MLLTRVIPCLLLKDGQMVKTVRFRNPVYVGDPVNAVKIYNAKEVDEIIFLDITATREGRRPPFDLIAHIAEECFMPFAYGGGIRTMDDIRTILGLGVEKVCINTAAAKDPGFVRDAARTFGSQSLIVSLDVKKRFFGGYRVYTRGGRSSSGPDPVVCAKTMEDAGAGEILLTAVDRDGTMEGFDIPLVKMVSEAVRVPVIACGGAGSLEDFGRAVHEGGASAAAAGSLVVFQGKNRSVLINFPSRRELKAVFP